MNKDCPMKFTVKCELRRLNLGRCTALALVAMFVTTTNANGNPDKKSQTTHRYSVVHGKGWSVCESYARFLNGQPADEPPPSCHLQLGPSLKEPNWQELDVHSSLDVIYSLEYPPYQNSLHPAKKPPSFDDWKAAFERDLQGGRVPRLRRAHIALVANGPEETVLAYEANRSDCDDEVKKSGYSHWGHGARLFLWDDRKDGVNDYRSILTFSSAPARLVLLRDEPFMFKIWWGGVSVRPDNKVHVGGRISVTHVFSVPSGGEPYGVKEVCQIGFELPADIVERMTK